MTDDNAATPKPSPLDAERARLRESGYTDSEVSQIPISRATGSPQAQATGVGVGVGGQGVLAGVLANLGVLLAHARNVLPALLLDFKKTFDGSAAPFERGKALGSLVVKLAIVGVLGYAVKQEWNQHIISTPEITVQQAREAGANANAATHHPRM